MSPYADAEKRKAWRKSEPQRKRNAEDQAKYREEQERLHALHVLAWMRERTGKWPAGVGAAKIAEVEAADGKIAAYRKRLWRGKTVAVLVPRDA